MRPDSSIFRLIAAVMLLLMSATVLMVPANAQAAPTEDTVAASCHDTDVEDGGVTLKIITCVEESVQVAVDKFFQGFYPRVEQLIDIVLIVSVTLFGVLIAIGGLEKIGRDTFTLLVKIAAVIYFTKEIDKFYPMVMDIVQGVLEIVTQFGVAADSGNLSCMSSDVMWTRVDCMLDVLIGTNMSGNNINGLSRGILAFLFRSLFSGPLGLIIALLGFYTVLGTLFAVIRAIQVYVASYVAIAFLMILAPIFVPMLLFRVTFTYFDKWLRIIMAMALQPILLFAYLTLMLVAMDQIIYSADYSFLNTITGGSDQNINEYLDSPAVNAYDECVKRIPLGADFNFAGINPDNVTVEPGGALGEKRLFAVEQTGEGESTQRTLVVRCVDYSRIAAANGISPTTAGLDTDSEIEDLGTVMQELTASGIIMVAMIAFVFMSMMKYVPALAHDLSGGFFETPSLHNQVAFEVGGPLQGVISGAGTAATNAIRSPIINFRRNTIGPMISG